jgi:hypothetical protein
LLLKLRDLIQEYMPVSAIVKLWRTLIHQCKTYCSILISKLAILLFLMVMEGTSVLCS